MPAVSFSLQPVQPAVVELKETGLHHSRTSMPRMMPSRRQGEALLLVPKVLGLLGIR